MAKFKPRARTLDLLGRQQIEGIPTALNELFKNAHDAYAENAEVDFFRKRQLLMLRDDGLGMTLDDFENRWLTIGTESKADTNSGISKPYTEKSSDKRPIMGEKGVGRLAIAAIGPQVLVISRAQRKGKFHDYVVAFINWSMFELPGIDLHEIEIPVKTFTSITDITNAAVKNLVIQVKKNLSSLSSKSDIEKIDKIHNQLEKFNFSEQLLNLSYGPSLTKKSSGTIFIITPTSENLEADIDSTNDDGVSRLQQQLCGFTNTMFSQNVPIRTEFRDHLIDGVTENRIGGDSFFTPQDYKKTDHHISGTFDEYGNFLGKISIYQEPPKKLEFIINKTAKKTRCGSFNIEFGYLQGAMKSSLLAKQDKEAYATLIKKTDKLGGIYMYRDGIRILPYGQSDFDWLEVEKRRTKHAGSAFFSYRRMIGAVDITRLANSALQEKAGREGFIANAAYRDFKSILFDFLKRLASKHFLEDGDYSRDWEASRNELQKEYALLKKRKNSVRDRKNSFEVKLAKYFEYLHNHSSDDPSKSKLEGELQKILHDTQNKVSVLEHDVSIEDAASTILTLEVQSMDKLRAIERKLTFTKPKIGLSKETTSNWIKYQESFKSEVTPLIESTELELTSYIGDISTKAKFHLDSQIRLQKSFESIKNFEFNKLRKVKSNFKQSNNLALEYIKNKQVTIKEEIAKTEDRFDQTIANLNQGADDSTINEARKELEISLTDLSSNITAEYERIRYSLDNISKVGNSEDNPEIISALENRLSALEGEYQSNLENLQLGLAVKIINHEFTSNIKSVRNSIKSLKRWSDSNESLKELYNRIRDGFDHLDNYLNLFTPLERRLQRRRTEITGSSILDFINKLYEDRFERHEVKLVASDKFKSHSISSYASTIYPVFINLVDNSIHWLTNTNTSPKEINLDASKDSFIISDNGPGIPLMDSSNIFDFGYTRKINGGGMGLYIAKSVLNKENLDITLSPQSPSRGAQFTIHPVIEND